MKRYLRLALWLYALAAVGILAVIIAGAIWIRGAR